MSVWVQFRWHHQFEMFSSIFRVLLICHALGLVQLIEKVRQHKRLMYSQRIKEKNI